MARPHLKMLSGDYYSNEYSSREKGGDPHCRLCPKSLGLLPETIPHILTECRGTIEPRMRIWPELLNAISLQFPENRLLGTIPDNNLVTQFILDCTSLNLPNGYRFDISHPGISDIFRVSRQYCYAVHSERLRHIRELS